MKKAAISIVSIMAILLTSLLPLHVSGASYWDLRAEYIAAVEAGDDSAIVEAAEKIEAFYAYDNSLESYLRRFSPVYQAAVSYETMQMYDQAGSAYERAKEYCEWLSLHDETEEGRNAWKEQLKCVICRCRYFLEPELYALTTNTDSIPYYAQKNEPEAGTYSGMCGTYSDVNQSAYLLYTQYITESFSSYSYAMPQTDKTYYLEAAWNVANENESDLDLINNGSTDKYMIEQLQYLESYTVDHPNCKILLRFGAEVNTWPDLGRFGSDAAQFDAFAAKFISAFRRIANNVHTYAPHVAMVYSPQDHGNWYTTPEQFYPGDEYVDWIGMSTYYNISSDDNFIIGDTSCTIWSHGLYENPIAKIADITSLAEAHGKPVMISECGFSYDNTDGLQTEAHAVKSLTEFYTMINMVYPQIKLINLFNNNINGSRYRIYETQYANDNTVSLPLQQAYESSITNNGAISSTLTSDDTPASYTKFSNFHEKADSIRVSAYLGYPSTAQKTVAYSINGQAVKTSSEFPYNVDITSDMFDEGSNILTAQFVCGNTSIIKEYVIHKDADGMIDTTLTPMNDIAHKSWYMDSIGYCASHKIMTGTSNVTFSPDITTSRAMIVTVLYRISGSPAVTGTMPFIDVKSSDYFYNAVLWAYQNNIAKGMTDTLFAPNSNVSREQTATFFFRYSGDYMNYDVSESGSINAFPDASEVGSYAVEPLEWAIGSGIIKGVSQGDANIIDPHGSATRAQIATILNRLCIKYNIL